jgi:hypothetical protein
VPVTGFLAGTFCAEELTINEEATNKSETTSARAVKKRGRKVFILFFSNQAGSWRKPYRAGNQDGLFNKHCLADALGSFNNFQKRDSRALTIHETHEMTRSAILLYVMLGVI